MPCIESTRRLGVPGLPGLPGLLALLLAACGSPQPPAPPPPPPQPVAPSAMPVVPSPVPAPVPSLVPSPSLSLPPSITPGPAVPGTAVTPPPLKPVPLAPPVTARNWDEFRLQAARRLVQAHPDGSYAGPAPEPLLAIPVLEVELNADGSVRRVNVLRRPTQAGDTTQLAIEAVHRAAPYGAMGRLPLPWKWVEVFLFDDNRRFKPRELDK